MKGKPVIIRTLDIGGDKEIPYLGLEKEDNPLITNISLLLQTELKNMQRAWECQ